MLAQNRTANSKQSQRFEKVVFAPSTGLRVLDTTELQILAQIQTCRHVNTEHFDWLRLIEVRSQTEV